MRVKEFLTENEIEFDDIDVSSDPAAAQEMVQKSDQMGVPVIEIDGEIVIGFDEQRLRILLGI
jgi:glutaredoxin